MLRAMIGYVEPGARSQAGAKPADLPMVLTNKGRQAAKSWGEVQCDRFLQQLWLTLSSAELALEMRSPIRICQVFACIVH